MVAGRGGAGAMKRVLTKTMMDLLLSGLDDEVLAYQHKGIPGLYHEDGRAYMDTGSLSLRVW